MAISVISSAGLLRVFVTAGTVLRVTSAVELMAPPNLSVVCFRVIHPTLHSEDAVGAFNRAVLERLQLGGDAFLSSTELRSRFTLRACIVNHRSRREDIDRMLDAIRAAAVAL